MSPSVGTSHTLVMHHGQRKPPLFMSEWYAPKLGGDNSGRRIGKPIIIRSTAGFVFSGRRIICAQYGIVGVAPVTIHMKGTLVMAVVIVVMVVIAL